VLVAIIVTEPAVATVVPDLALSDKGDDHGAAVQHTNIQCTNYLALQLYILTHYYCRKVVEPTPALVREH
jgi:hypothetical protein